MKTFHCDSCGEVDHVLLDGYPVGDRLLEGVLFEIRYSKIGAFDVAISPKHANYFEGLNKEKWLDAITKYAKNMDVVQCPKCKNDIYFD